MWKHFHALRPLRLGITCLAPMIPKLINELFNELPCRLHWVAGPVSDDTRRAASLSLTRLAAVVREERLQAGFLIGDDGHTCRVIDERGKELRAEALLPAFARQLREEAPRQTIVLDNALPEIAAQRLGSLGFHVARTHGTREAIARALREATAALAADEAGRYWFHDRFPTCDALLTLARLLQALSARDAPASALGSD